MPKITIKITRLHENFGQDDGIEGPCTSVTSSNRKCIGKHIPKVSAQYKRLNALFFLCFIFKELLLSLTLDTATK